MIMAYLISNPQFNIWNISYITYFNFSFSHTPLISLTFNFPASYSTVLYISLVIIKIKQFLEKMNSTKIILHQARKTAKHLISKKCSSPPLSAYQASASCTGMMGHSSTLRGFKHAPRTQQIPLTSSCLLTIGPSILPPKRTCNIALTSSLKPATTLGYQSAPRWLRWYTNPHRGSPTLKLTSPSTYKDST